MIVLPTFTVAVCPVYTWIPPPLPAVVLLVIVLFLMVMVPLVSIESAPPARLEFPEIVQFVIVALVPTLRFIALPSLLPTLPVIAVFVTWSYAGLLFAHQRSRAGADLPLSDKGRPNGHSAHPTEQAP